MEIFLEWNLLVALVLAAVAALHVLWGLGVPWPARNAEELAGAVIGGQGAQDLPPLGPCLTVAVLLLVAAGLVATAPSGPAAVRLGALAVAGVLLMRGAGGYLMPMLVPQLRNPPFYRLNAWVYSPLCLLLGLTIVLGLQA